MRSLYVLVLRYWIPADDIPGILAVPVTAD
jgi:hypothetical protein